MRLHAAACWVLTVLFAARVAGQAIQAWMPREGLPSFDAFQGSNLPYWLLLPVQLAILGWMAFLSWRIQSARLAASSRIGRVLAWLGAVYLVIALGRFGVGIAFPDAPAWFRTWVPAFFHIVLASFVLVVSLYHLRGVWRGKGT